ncbi:E3 ubiquitin/ISG15 ligase TRIM25-like [Anomaloglossus baeobatrachus]|uniref:E3 ubiquitin/ISG15 ligase TRIM25-like n=1 Tax=Anomaloglossus baeobatrachus TaxID=238106 RepID=UPI003F50AA0F
MASADLKDELTCSICLNLYTDPITLKCGHNFCRECIESVLDTQKGSEAYTCPECRAEFLERPVLQRNTTLCNIAEHFLSQEEQEGTEVFCMYCIHTPVVASKTCLMCEASLCDLHLAVHSKSPEHVLIQPTKSFRNRRCSHHKKPLMYYCTEDAECLCAFCCLGEKHKGHKVEFLHEAVIKKQEKLRTFQGHILKEREKIETRVNRLQDHLRDIPEKATGIVERVGVQLQDLKKKQDNLEIHVLKEVSKQQEQVSMSVSDLIQQLEKKRDSLSWKLTTMEKLCQMTDPLLYLQADRNYFTEMVEDSEINLKETEAADLAEDLINKTLISGIMNIMSDLQKGYYVQEAAGILLDVNTASNDVHISGDLKTSSSSNVNLGRPETPQRFEDLRVLSMEGFSKGRLYWDVEVSKEGSWRVGMAYPSIQRRGENSHVGANTKSWGLRRFKNQYSVRHDKKEITVEGQASCYKVRIYLDYTDGLLSFYELANTMRHLYTYNATFTEALYPVIAVWDNAWARVLN